MTDTKKPRRVDHLPMKKLSSIFHKTELVGECWEWRGTMFKKYISGLEYWQYPCITFKGKSWRGNRLVWTLIHGEIPAGMNVLHKCDNPKCIKPLHLYLGTQKENVRDTLERGRHREAAQTHCKYDHPFSGENLRVGADRKRYCRTCAWYHNRKTKPQAEMKYGS